MKYTKAVECDFCGQIEVSTTKSRFKSWFKLIRWIQVVQGNGITKEFCSKECYKHYKEEVGNEKES
jgi:hypothetical protein